MTEPVEDQLLKMSNYLQKLHKHKICDARLEKQLDGSIEIDSLMSPVRSHVYNLGNKIEYNHNR